MIKEMPSEHLEKKEALTGTRGEFLGAGNTRVTSSFAKFSRMDASQCLPCYTFEQEGGCGMVAPRKVL
jgi:hypothetical protein